MARNIPFPSNDVPIGNFQPSQKVDTKEPPWKKLEHSITMPMCFEIQLRNGEIYTFPYSDFRGARLMNAGYLIINVLGMEKYQITVEGRHLGELTKLLSLGKLCEFHETPNHGYELPETSPHIERIEIEALTGP